MAMVLFPVDKAELPGSQYNQTQQPRITDRNQKMQNLPASPNSTE
jgi:hypothetical protein